MADLPHIPREPIYDFNGRRIESEVQAQMFTMLFNAHEVPKPLVCGVMLELLLLDIVTEREQKRPQCLYYVQNFRRRLAPSPGAGPRSRWRCSRHGIHQF